MAEEPVQKGSEQPPAAFVLSLLAGVWMLAAGGMMGGYGMIGGYGMMGGGAGAGYGGYGMGGYGGMHGWMWGSGMYGSGPSRMWLGVAAGLLVIVSAFALYVKPAARKSWGVVILVVSALDFILGMGGLLAGILGIIGGALAIAA